MRNSIAIERLLLLTALSLFGTKLHAQDNPEGGDDVAAEAETSGSFQAGGQAQPTWQPTVTQPQPAADTASTEQDSGGSDHSAQVGNFGVGLFGVMALPIMLCDGPGCAAADGQGSVAAPTIGIRYWLDDTLGIEGGLGLNVSSGSAGNTDVSFFGLGLHGGVPLALAHSGHFVFEIVPQLNFGITSGSYENTAPNGLTTDVSGLLFEMGAKVGAEVHFGFIDLPQLSLQGTVGLMIRHEGRSAETVLPAPAPAQKFDQSATAFATGVDAAPWEIFTSSIAAIYYF